MGEIEKALAKAREARDWEQANREDQAAKKAAALSELTRFEAEFLQLMGSSGNPGLVSILSRRQIRSGWRQNKIHTEYFVLVEAWAWSRTDMALTPNGEYYWVAWQDPSDVGAAHGWHVDHPKYGIPYPYEPFPPARNRDTFFESSTVSFVQIQRLIEDMAERLVGHGLA